MPQSLYNAEIVSVTGQPVQTVKLRVQGPYTFRAGQYLQVQAPDGTQIPLSIASAPTRLPELELHYRSTPELPEAKIMDHLLTGDSLMLTGASGDVRSGAPGQPLFIVAAGTGAAQAFSCAEYRAQMLHGPTTILWCADDASDVYQQDILEHLVDVELHITVDNRRTPENEGLVWLSNNCGQFHDAYVVIAGGPGFVYAATDVLLTHGFPREQLHADAYAYAPR